MTSDKETDDGRALAPEVEKHLYDPDSDTATSIPIELISVDDMAKFVGINFYDDEMRVLLDKLSPEALAEVKTAFLETLDECQLEIEPDSFALVTVAESQTGEVEVETTDPTDVVGDDIEDLEAEEPEEGDGEGEEEEIPVPPGKGHR